MDASKPGPMVRGHDDGCKRKKCPREERVGGTESEACAREVKFQPKLQLFVMSAVEARRISFGRRSFETAGRGQV